MRIPRVLFGLAAVFSTIGPAMAASAEPLSMLGLSAGKNGGSLSVPMQIVILLTLMTVRPALGTQSTPSNQVLLGLSLFLAIVIMQPVVADMYHQGWEPMEAGHLTPTQALEQGSKPLHNFLVRFAREKDIKLFVEIARAPAPRTSADLDMKTLIPAYILSELKTGFQIGAVLFLPFLVIDLVIASVTLSIGMVQLPPVMISAPFKILLFVLVDGWNLVVGSLMKSFYS